MMRSYKKFLSGLLFFFLMVLSFAGCTGGDADNLLAFAAIVVIDSDLNRIFVIDNRDNGLNLIDATDNNVITKGDDEPLLTDEDDKLLPDFPSNGALAPLPASLSRIFVIGADPDPSLSITVLDFDDAGGLRTSAISPINVPGAVNDVLLGIVVDSELGLLFVTNSTSGLLHIFDVNSGLEVADSPINVGVGAGRLAVDLESDLLAVANSSTTLVSFVDLTDLTLPVVTLDIGIFSRDLAMASNGSGSVLFLSGAQENIAQVYSLDLVDLSASSLIFELTPTTPTDPVPDPAFLTGNLNQVSAGNLTDGRMAGFYTQSTGDVLVLDLTQDLTTLTPAVILIGAVSGEGIANLLNSSDQTISVYFASPGLGSLTEINPLLNEFEDQIQ